MEDAIRRGQFAAPGEGLALLSGLGAVLGALLVVVLLTESYRERLGRRGQLEPRALE